MTALPNSWAIKHLSAVAEPCGTSIDPRAFPDEMFTLYSVPSFDQRNPEETKGSVIGSHKQIVNPGTLLVCKINPRINRVWL